MAAWQGLFYTRRLKDLGSAGLRRVSGSPPESVSAYRPSLLQASGPVLDAGWDPAGAQLGLVRPRIRQPPARHQQWAKEVGVLGTPSQPGFWPRLPHLESGAVTEPAF